MSKGTRIVKISKYLSKHLRHRPERLGLHLDEGGWVSVESLLDACNSSNFSLTRAELNQVVERNDKRRFSFDATGTRVRANHGHSVQVDLNAQVAIPPDLLFHGTYEKAWPEIRSNGLRPMGRKYVHLSADIDSAVIVGRRRGKPVVLEVAARDMTQAGHTFVLATNGIWLTSYVPAHHLRLHREGDGDT